MSTGIINPQTPKDTTVRLALNNFLKSNRAKLIALLLLIVIIAFGFFLFHKNNTKQPAISAPGAGATKYSVASLSPYTLPGVPAGDGVSFDKLPEFKLASTANIPGSQADSTQLLLTQPSADGSVPDIGRIALEIISSNQSSVSTDLANFTKTAAKPDPQDQTYQALLRPLQDFVNQRLPKDYSVIAFGIPLPLATPNIASGAWLIGFGAVGPTENLPPLTGELALVYGKQVIYYFMAENTGPTWVANQTVWQKVFNSLKVNQ